MMNGQNRSDVKIGAAVKIVLKADRRNCSSAIDKEQLPSPWHKSDA